MLRSKSRFGALTVVMVSAFLFVGHSRAEGIGQTEALAHNCTVCHGAEAQGSKKIPKLRGLDKKDIVQSMKGFRSGEERSTIMGHFAGAYSDTEIELLAGYFSKLD